MYCWKRSWSQTSKKDRLINGSYCLPCLSGQYYQWLPQNPPGRGSASSGHITIPQQSTFLQISMVLVYKSGHHLIHKMPQMSNNFMLNSCVELEIFLFYSKSTLKVSSTAGAYAIKFFTIVNDKLEHLSPSVISTLVQ